MKKFILTGVFLLMLASNALAINLTRVNGKVLFKNNNYYLTNVYLLEGNFKKDILELVASSGEMKISPVAASYFGALLINEAQIKTRRDRVETTRAGLAKMRSATLNNVNSNGMEKSVNIVPAASSVPSVTEAPISMDSFSSCMGEGIEASVSGSIEKDGDDLVIKVYSFNCYNANAEDVI